MSSFLSLIYMHLCMYINLSYDLDACFLVFWYVLDACLSSKYEMRNAKTFFL